MNKTYNDLLGVVRDVQSATGYDLNISFNNDAYHVNVIGPMVIKQFDSTDISLLIDALIRNYKLG